jgi:hypothetical protein
MITLVSIETTPNPNSMKLNLSETVTTTRTYTVAEKASAPPIVQQLLQIEGVVSIFGTASFLTLNRDPRVDWQAILASAQSIFSGEVPETSLEADMEERRLAAEKQGQVQVWVQTFRKIPIQVKVTDGISEERTALPERFGTAARELQVHLGADYLKERYWADWGIRYGTLTEVAQEVAEEIESLLDTAGLEQEKQLALEKTPSLLQSEALPETIRKNLESPDWQERFQAVQQLSASEENMALLVKALQDEKPQIRRWTAAKLAGIKTSESVQALCGAMLNDSSVGVRRTAGDSLSDIGDVSAMAAACQALGDNNKLVRWRAARFLAEIGTEEALPNLEKAQNDSEYEVRLEVAAAIHHIQTGSKAALPVWKLMAQENHELQT